MTVLRQRRLRALTASMATMPITQSAQQTAFEVFCGSGELPEEERFAAAVVDRVRTVVMQKRPRIDHATSIRRLASLIDQIEAGVLPPEPEDLRETLFQEAVVGVGFVRVAARAAWRRLVGKGADVTSPDLFADVAAPAFGTMGLRVVGFPAGLGNRNDGQWARFRRRLGALRRRVDWGDEVWSVALAEAGVRFRSEGVLPEAEVLREAVQANAELLVMLEQLRGDEMLDSLRSAIEAGDVAAHKVLLCRLRYPSSSAERPDAGPPVPRGNDLVVWMRESVNLWLHDLQATGPGGAT